MIKYMQVIFMDKKVAIITGGSRGIGAAISEKFASNGYNVTINYKSNDEKANEIKNKLENTYKIKVLLVKGDLSNEDDIKEIVSKTIDYFGRIDCLINNAGICKDAPFDDKTKETYMKILEVNLVAPFLLSKYAKEELIKNNGTIINIASTNGINAYYPESLDYDSSKAGLINLTKNLAMHFSPNVRVNAVCPGWTNTDMIKDLEPHYRENEKNNVLLKRFAEPEEIASTVYFLASDESSYVNGQIISVDGGCYGY